MSLGRRGGGEGASAGAMGWIWGGSIGGMDLGLVA